MIFPPFTQQLAVEAAMVLGPLLGIVAGAPPADRPLAAPAPPASQAPRLIFTGWKDDTARLRMYRAGHARSMTVAAAARLRIARA